MNHSRAENPWIRRQHIRGLAAIGLGAVGLTMLSGAAALGPLSLKEDFDPKAPSTKLSPQFPAAAIGQNGTRSAIYQTGGFSFGLTNQLLPNALPVGQYQDVEPEIKIDLFGNIYVTAIQGVPDGLDLWKSTDQGQTFTFLGQPDGVQCLTQPICADEIGVGGADDSIAVSSGGHLYISSLWFGSLSFATSSNGGFAPWLQNPVASNIPSVDRQWIAAFGPQTVYLSYNQIVPFAVGMPDTNVVFIQKSTDGGKTFSAPAPMYPVDSPVVAAWQGNLAVDQYNGNIYTTFRPYEANGHTRAELWLLKSTDGGSTWSLNKIYQGASGKDAANVWPIMAVDRGGNVHLAFSECDRNYATGVNSNCVVKLMSSSDGGNTWLDPVQVNNGQETRYAVEPWMVAGGPGIVDLAWYGADIDSSDQSGQWHVYFSQTRNALASSPTFNQVKAVPQVVHTRDICLDGASCTGDRSLAEYFTVTLDPGGNANIAFSDDVNNTSSFNGGLARTWYTKQISGPSAFNPVSGPAAATFAPSVAIPNSDGRNEPNMHVDSHNCIFAAAINGTSSAVAKSADNGASFGSMKAIGMVGIGPHGADCDITTIPKPDHSRPDYLYTADLGITSVHIGKSTDGGNTFAEPGMNGSAGEAAPSSDRMWFAWDKNLPSAGDQTVYLMDHEAASETIRFAALTNDLAWSPPNDAMTAPELIAPPDSTIPNTYPGRAFVLPTTDEVCGLFAASTVATNTMAPPFGKTPNAWLAIGPPPSAAGFPPGPFTDYPVFKGLLDSPATAPAAAITYGNSIGNLWPSAAADSSGNIYAAWAMNNARVNAAQSDTGAPSTTFDIWMAVSHDGGKNFYGPFKVSSGTGTSIFPWITAGDAGRVDIVWYQSSSIGPPLTADPSNPGSLTGGSNSMPPGSTWNVMFAQSLNANDREPSFTVVQAGDHVMHTGSISTGGLTGIFNDRSLGDFFEVAIGPDGLANIAYTDTSMSPNDIAYLRQKSGPIALTNPTFPTCLGDVVPLLGIASRKSHGAAGDFDIDLGQGGNSGIECRSGGANGDYKIVFTFSNNLISVDHASIESGVGSVASSIIGPNPNQYTVNLTGIANAQHITVTLRAVHDTTDNIADVSTSMRVLVGDTNGDGFVNSADIGQTKSKSGQAVDSTNFREDVNADGFLNSADIGLVKSKSGTALP
jgi:hypothetical protein